MRVRALKLGIIGAAGVAACRSGLALPHPVLRAEEAKLTELPTPPNIPKLQDLAGNGNASATYLAGSGNWGGTAQDEKRSEMGPSPEPCGDECVLVVGTTGTGKSATIAKMTGQQVEVSSAAQSVTRKCEIFQGTHNKSIARHAK